MLDPLVKQTIYKTHFLIPRHYQKQEKRTFVIYELLKFKVDDNASTTYDFNNYNVGGVRNNKQKINALFILGLHRLKN